MRPKPASGPDRGRLSNSLISVLVIPWFGSQSAGHFDTSSVKPPAPWYRSLLFGSCPYCPLPLSGITGPGVISSAAPLAADDDGADESLGAAEPAADDGVVA